MMINNKTGWKKRFYGHNPLVEQLTRLNKLAISKVRKILVDHQLIYYEPGHKGKAPIYDMISLVQSIGPMVQPVDLVGKPVDQMDNSVDHPFIIKFDTEFDTLLKKKLKTKEK